MGIIVHLFILLAIWAQVSVGLGDGFCHYGGMWGYLLSFLAVHSSSFCLHLCWIYIVVLLFKSAFSDDKLWTKISKESLIYCTQTCHQDHSVYAPSQWEIMLHCYVIINSLGAYTKWSLCHLFIYHQTHYMCTQYSLVKLSQYHYMSVMIMITWLT